MLALIASVCEPPPFGPCSPGAIDMFSRGLGIVALLWSAAVAVVAVRGGALRIRRLLIIWLLPLVALLPLYFTQDFDTDIGMWSALAGWVWGIGFAVAVHRATRHVVRVPKHDVDQPIAPTVGMIVIAVCAPLLSPIPFMIGSWFA